MVDFRRAGHDYSACAWVLHFDVIYTYIIIKCAWVLHFDVIYTWIIISVTVFFILQSASLVIVDESISNSEWIWYSLQHVTAHTKWFCWSSTKDFILQQYSSSTLLSLLTFIFIALLMHSGLLLWYWFRECASLASSLTGAIGYT